MADDTAETGEEEHECHIIDEATLREDAPAAQFLDRAEAWGAYMEEWAFLGRVAAIRAKSLPSGSPRWRACLRVSKQCLDWARMALRRQQQDVVTADTLYQLRYLTDDDDDEDLGGAEVALAADPEDDSDGADRGREVDG